MLRDLTNARVHMIGIAGSGMSGLAAFLLRRGATVSGTDAGGGGRTLLRLAEAGARISTVGASFTPDQLDLVVRSAAVPDAHPEVRLAQSRGVPVIKYAEMLGHLMDQCEGVAISGTHGKSTTAAWLTYVLRRAELDPSFVIGAHVPQLRGGSGAGDGAHFIAEACEFDRSFLNLRPQRAVILNIEEDHLDCYENLDAIAEAFTAFAGQVRPDGLLVLNANDSRCRRIAEQVRVPVELFGPGCGVLWRAGDLELVQGRYRFSVYYGEEELGRVQIGLAGRHNVANALAVIALARDCGVSWPRIEATLGDFSGAQRRLELRGVFGGVRVVDDYAHHPTEIQATLQAARERFEPRKLWCIFQPHQHSRTRFLMDHFAESFSFADRVVVPDIYFVRDSERDRQAIQATDLVARIQQHGLRAEYVPSFSEIVEHVAAEAAPGDVVITMGAGNIWKVADELLHRLGGNLSD